MLKKAHVKTGYGTSETMTAQRTAWLDGEGISSIGRDINVVCGPRRLFPWIGQLPRLRGFTLTISPASTSNSWFFVQFLTPWRRQLVERPVSWAANKLETHFPIRFSSFIFYRFNSSTIEAKVCIMFLVNGPWTTAWRQVGKFTDAESVRTREFHAQTPRPYPFEHRRRASGNVFC